MSDERSKKDEEGRANKEAVFLLEERSRYKKQTLRTCKTYTIISNSPNVCSSLSLTGVLPDAAQCSLVKLFSLIQ